MKNNERWVDALEHTGVGKFGLHPDEKRYMVIVLSHLINAAEPFASDEKKMQGVLYAGVFVRQWRIGLDVESYRFDDQDDDWSDNELLRSAIRHVTFAEKACANGQPDVAAGYLRGVESFLRTWWKQNRPKPVEEQRDRVPCGKCSTCLDARDRALSDSTQWVRAALFRGMVVCAKCGNKRCPHAWDCTWRCTGSNEPNQVPMREEC
jgi:hypothetical protein